MKLLTKAIREKMLANARTSRALSIEGKSEPDFLPVVKLFTPDAQCTWLLTELVPENHDTAFGLCDLGMGMPELGYVNLSEIQSLRGKLGLPVERDRYFTPEKTISAYADEARSHSYIKA